MPSRWDAATHGWSRRVFHYPLPTLMSRNFRLPRTIELQPLSLTPLKMRKVEVRCYATLWRLGACMLRRVARRSRRMASTGAKRGVVVAEACIRLRYE